MILDGTFLYFGTKPEEIKDHYPHYQEIFAAGRKISTQLPKNIVAIRTIAIAALSVFYFATSSTLVAWTIAPIGFLFAGWTIYSHLIRSDQLVNAIYKIVGSKEKYDALPELKLSESDKPFEEIIQKIVWDKLEKPVYKAYTQDGRVALIVKAMSRYKESKSIMIEPCQVKSTYALIERLRPNDYFPEKDLTSKQSSIIFSCLYAFNILETGNPIGRMISSSSSSSSFAGSVPESYEKHMLSSISSEMTNEFAAQLRT